MLNRITILLFGLAAVYLWIVLPLNDFIHRDASGKKLTARSVPPVSSKNELYKGEWWRDSDTILHIRAQHAELSDEEFLSEHLFDEEIYTHIAEALRRSAASRANGRCEETATRNSATAAVDFSDDRERLRSSLRK
jgi:hypothetical protein